MSWEFIDFKLAVKDITGGNRKFLNSEYLDQGLNPIIDQSEKFISGYTNEKSIVSRTKDVVIFGDHTKALKYVDFDFCLGADGVKVLEPIESLDSKFLFHFLGTVKLPNVGYSRHFKFLKEIQIPLPPLATQKRIAEILDAADALRRKDQELLKKYDELAQAIFIDMFGDPQLNEKNFKRNLIGNEVSFIGGSQPPKNKFHYKPGEGLVRLIQIRDYKSDKFITYINKNSTRKFCNAEDVMIGRYGPPVFQILRGIEGAYNVALMKAIPKSNLDSEYLFYLLSTNYLQNIIISNSQRTAGQTGVNLEILEQIEVSIPPLEIQLEFKKRIKIVNDSFKHSEESHKKSSNHFQSLIQKAFKGELVA